MKPNRRLHIVGATVLVLVLCIGGRWLLVGDQNVDVSPDDTPTKVESVPTGAPKPSASPSVGTTDTRVKLVDPVIRQFVAVYYSRSEHMTEAVMNDRLKPFVTNRFMREYFPDLSSDGDPWFRVDGAEVTANGLPLPADYFDVAETLAVTTLVSQRQVPTATNPAREYSFTVTIEVTWSDGWRVSSFL